MQRTFCIIFSVFYSISIRQLKKTGVLQKSIAPFQNWTFLKMSKNKNLSHFFFGFLLNK